jgi:hypothetical protein
VIEFVSGVFLATFFGFLVGEALVDVANGAGGGPRGRF